MKILSKYLFFLVVFLKLLTVSCSTARNYYKVSIGKETAVELEAIGVELDPHFFSQNLTRNDGSKESDWNIVIDRLKRMKVKKLRVMVLPQWFEPINDNADPHLTDSTKFTFESVEMKSLYKVLDIAQNQGMDVCLVVWGCPTNVSLLDPQYKDIRISFMADPNKKDVWITGPTDYDEWAENYSVLVNYLRNNKKYTCVNEITPMNEPDGGPLLTSIEYIKMAKILDSRFKKDGIRDQVRFNLSDNTDTRTFYLEDCAANLKDEADLFNSHTYIFGYETPNDIIFDWEKNNVDISSRAGKKHLVGEFGSNQTVGATRQRDIDFYDRGILMTRLVLNFFNAGAAGVSYWSLIDQYYGKDEDYQQMQQLGMWKYIKEAYKNDSTYAQIKKDYEVRPQYYAYSLLTRFLQPGAKMYPIDLNDNFAIGTGFKDKEGKWVYVFANGSDHVKSIAVNNSFLEEGKFEMYRYEADSLPLEDNLIESDERNSKKKGVIYLKIAANSVVLCRQL